MRVLVVTPVYQLYQETLRRILDQDWPARYDVLLLQNEAPGLEHPYDRVTAKYQDARRQALVGGYDAMLCVEADMLIPRHALRGLIETEAPVAYGLYCWRHADVGYAWSAYLRVGEHHGVSLSSEPALARQHWGDMIRVAGVGMGCTLIRRPVLEALDFRRDPMVCNDWSFALDCQRLDIPQVCHTGVACGHIATDPRRILWPDPDQDMLYREEAL